MRSITRAR